MKLGAILGDGQQQLRDAVRKDRERKREAERNRKRSRGELIRYARREK